MVVTEHIIMWGGSAPLDLVAKVQCYMLVGITITITIFIPYL